MSYMWMFMLGIGVSWAWIHFSVAKALHNRIEALEDEFLWNRTSGRSSAPPAHEE